MTNIQSLCTLISMIEMNVLRNQCQRTAYVTKVCLCAHCAQQRANEMKQKQLCGEIVKKKFN